MTVKFNFIGLVVADIPASLVFYRRLGLDIPTAADTEPHVEVALPGGLRLAWDGESTIKSFDPAWTPPTGGRRVDLAFECESPAEVDSAFADLVDAGYTGQVKPWDAFWGQRYAIVHDPDGNPVDLYAALPA